MYMMTQWRAGECPDVTSAVFGKAGVRLCSGTHRVWATDLLQDFLRRLTHAHSGSAARREREKRLRIICFSKHCLIQKTQQLRVCAPRGRIRCIIWSSSWGMDSIYGWIYGSNPSSRIRFCITEAWRGPAALRLSTIIPLDSRPFTWKNRAFLSTTARKQ